MTDRPSVAFVGNAIVDVLGEATDAFLAARGLEKGSMALVDGRTSGDLYAAMDDRRRRDDVPCGSVRARSEAPGGSACNTAAVAATLGLDATFLGKVGDDALGRAYRHETERLGVAFPCAAHDGPEATARCMVFVTPDGERTMNTHLGACLELHPGDIDGDFLSEADATFVEGYLFDAPKSAAAAAKAVDVAVKAGRTVALTLSDAGCVDRHRSEFLTMIGSGAVGIVFANEREAMSLARVDDVEDAILFLGAHADLAVVTLGADGAVAVSGDRTVRGRCETVERVVDLTGAGDAFAAGFLAAHLAGEPLARSLELGAVASASVITRVGARPGPDLAEVAAERGFRTVSAVHAGRSAA